jgi:hypothetical protein
MLGMNPLSALGGGTCGAAVEPDREEDGEVGREGTGWLAWRACRVSVIHRGEEGKKEGGQGKERGRGHDCLFAMSS